MIEYLLTFWLFILAFLFIVWFILATLIVWYLTEKEYRGWKNLLKEKRK